MNFMKRGGKLFEIIIGLIFSLAHIIMNKKIIEIK